ncbi:MAG: ribonuclease III [Chromatiales bacterium]
MRKHSAGLAAALGIRFDSSELLEQALTHRSAGQPHNERLEFLGDAILGMIVAERLFDRFPEASEGQLSRLRAQLVKRDTLAKIAREIGLGEYLLMGSGELRAGGQSRDSTLSDALEAFLGAVYLDSGAESVEQVFDKLFTERLQKLDLSRSVKDPKTRLQEYLQSRNLALPEYSITATSGKQHQQRFEVECSLPDLGITATGEGRSRRKAEQDAATIALDVIGQGSDG